MKLIAKKFRTTSIFLLSAGICFFLGLKYLPRGQHNTSANAIGFSTEGALATGFEFTEYNSGEKSFVIKAEKLYLRNKKIKPFGFRIALGKSAELEDVVITFYKDNKPVSHLKSKFAVMDRKKRNIVFSGMPLLVTEDNNTLSAREIVWDNSQKRLCASGGCFLGLGSGKYRSEAIYADPELKNFSISSEKRNIFKPKIGG